MRKEHYYFLSILFFFSFTIYFLLLLLKKYATLTLEHFWGTCTELASGFFSKGPHYIGFTLVALVVVITLVLFLKTILSYIKTKGRLAVLLQKQTNFLPYRLMAILEKNDLQKDTIIIVRDKNVYAFTIDWFSPKIVISSQLLHRLSYKKLEAVILHEQYHLKYRHPLLLVTSEILSTSLSLLPILRDLTRRMRTVLEKEADYYVFRQQQTSKYLNLALDMVSSQDRFNIYPNLSRPQDDGYTLQRRNDYKFKKVNVLVSVVVILIGIFLIKSPGEAHASQSALGSSKLSNCGQNLCSAHCPADNHLKSSNYTPSVRVTYSSFE